MKRQQVAKQEAKPRFGFVRDVISELKKVAWPSREEATRLTFIVLAVTVALALALGAVDWAFSKFAENILIK